MQRDLFDDLINKFLRGDATPHEKRMLAGWLREDVAHEEIFYYHLSKLESTNPQFLPEVNSKLASYEQYLSGHRRIASPASVERAKRPIGAGGYWRVAAAFIILMATAVFLFRDDLLYRTYAAANGRISFITLPDGSTVTLNANSSIRVFRNFMDHESREVWIRGEGFFEVTKKEDAMKFIVHTDNFDVEVLGTKFNVNNRRGKTEVMLAEGKVKLVAKDRQPLIMKPGDQVSLSETEDHYKKQVVAPEKLESWRKHKLSFEDTPLWEVAQTIEEYYGVKVIIADPELGRRHFTGTLPNNDLEVILMALKTAYPVAIDKNKDRIIITRMSN